MQVVKLENYSSHSGNAKAERKTSSYYSALQKQRPSLNNSPVQEHFGRTTSQQALLPLCMSEDTFLQYHKLDCFIQIQEVSH